MKLNESFQTIILSILFIHGCDINPSLFICKTVLKNIVTYRLKRQNNKPLDHFLLLWTLHNKIKMHEKYCQFYYHHTVNFQVLTKYLEQFLPHICRLSINICWINERMYKSFKILNLWAKVTEIKILHDIIYMWNLKVEFWKWWV